MRILTLISAMLFTAVSGFAMDITTLDGNTYKDVEILGVYPNGIDFSYKGDGDGSYIVGEKFTNLPPSIRKKYHYNPARAKNFSIQCKEFQEHRYEKAQERAIEKIKDLKEQQYIDDTVGALVNAHRISQVRFQVTKTYRNGSLIVLADPAGFSETVGAKFGQFFVEGYDSSEQNAWGFGTFYPTGKSIKLVEGTFKVYTTSYDLAVVSMTEVLREKGKIQ